ncbi:hypothetical protein J2R88_002418 [Bradyrhizobium japonicum]|nr:hypothetical protein [Bradyrhizobium japonicum]MCP1792548.1 hypothetical protein [Bradyrhizobium japonicum]MCP1804983.1 hypothetical protein [Bradyrhizobium japonicum]MCP1814004.1 hypothetical protein [Bradyrhizobium japonicum]MCP1878415.1 hypothetical protein [Bradyrhizobium japonicum]
MFVRRIFTLLSLAICLAIGAASADEGRGQPSADTKLAFSVQKFNRPASPLIQRASSACGGPIDNPCNIFSRPECYRRYVGGSSDNTCTPCRSCGNGCGNNSC